MVVGVLVLILVIVDEEKELERTLDVPNVEVVTLLPPNILLVERADGVEVICVVVDLLGLLLLRLDDSDAWDEVELVTILLPIPDEDTLVGAELTTCEVDVELDQINVEDGYVVLVVDELPRLLLVKLDDGKVEDGFTLVALLLHADDEETHWSMPRGYSGLVQQSHKRWRWHQG